MTKTGFPFLRCLCLMMFFASMSLMAQRMLYPSHFDLSEVTLLDSPFKQAMDRNCLALLDYDVDRLLTPYVRQSGLSSTASGQYADWEAKHPAFQSWAWNPEMAMDGHVAGHYLSALSLSYASSRDAGMKGKLLERINHIVDILCDCQAVFDKDKNGLKGFIGGLPDNEIWKSLYSGDYHVYNQRGNWVPFYCEHKVMAGLRDAYVYTGNTKARDAFQKMCDWAIEVVHNFKDADMEMQILQWEPGAINEVLADAYHLFGDGKYMSGANKFSHQVMVEGILRGDEGNFLNLKNVNETSAKFLGYARITELKNNERYDRATTAFWNDVVENRVTAIGGTGINGAFQPVNKSTRFISEADGPDACGTYNLLKLTERLFDRARNARLTDYYERALINHILGNQDPESGGYVYHTSLRPNTHRIYSKPNTSMWCCVGTGMESQAKYGDFIYTFNEDTLFVNLFIASELKSEKVALRQDSRFPFGQKSKITIQKSGNYVIAIRRPSWTNDNYMVTVNGKTPKGFTPSRREESSFYVSCGKSWKEGDVIEVSYPMSLSFEECPRVPTYIALKFGPTVLAGVTDQSTSQAPFENEYADGSRRDHSNSTRQILPGLGAAPMLISERSQIPTRISIKEEANLVFNVDASAPGSQWKTVELKPFFKAQHSRNTVYWNQQNETAWLRNPLYLKEKQASALAKLTMDQIKVGDEPSEVKHNMKISETGSCGSLNGHTFRDCPPNQWFQYDLALGDKVSLAKGDSVTIILRLSVIDRGRKGGVYLDGKLAKPVVIPSQVKNASKDRFFEMPIVVSAESIVGKTTVPIRFVATPDGPFPRLYGIRFAKKE